MGKCEEKIRQNMKKKNPVNIARRSAVTMTKAGPDVFLIFL